MCLNNSLARSFRQRDHQKLVTRVFSKYTRLLTLSSRCGGLVTTAPTTLPLFTTSFGRPSVATRALNYVIYLHIVDTFLVYFQLKIRLRITRLVCTKGTRQKNSLWACSLQVWAIQRPNSERNDEEYKKRSFLYSASKNKFLCKQTQRSSRVARFFYCKPNFRK